MQQLADIPQLENVRGRGLMIGFDVPEEIKDLKKRLLLNQKIFTGEAKPNVIRLLPSLALNQKDADSFMEAVSDEILSYRKYPNNSKGMKQFISVSDVTDIKALVNKALAYKQDPWKDQAPWSPEKDRLLIP